MQIKMENGRLYRQLCTAWLSQGPGEQKPFDRQRRDSSVIRQIYEVRAEGISYMGINAKLNEVVFLLQSVQGGSRYSYEQ
jgi:hypothetical protein